MCRGFQKTAAYSFDFHSKILLDELVIFVFQSIVEFIIVVVGFLAFSIPSRPIWVSITLFIIYRRIVDQIFQFFTDFILVI